MEKWEPENETKLQEKEFETIVRISLFFEQKITHYSQVSKLLVISLLSQ